MDEHVDYKALGFRTREEFDFPNIVNVEVYRGTCYCNCIHCPVGTTAPISRKERFKEKGLDLGLYRKIVAEISQHPHSTIRIHSVGEPLLWEGLVEALHFSRKKQVRSWVFTCAATPETNTLEALCEEADVIEISVNSTEPKDYIRTKGIDAFELVSENMSKMHEHIKSRDLTTRLLASRVETLDRDADEEFVKYWKSTGVVDDAFVRSYHTYNDLLSERIPSEKKHEACLVHWARFNISVEGYAVVCFNELFKPQLVPSVILGDLREQTIAEIWRGPKLTQLRKAELSGDYCDLAWGKNIPCKDCVSYQPLSGERQTSEYQISNLNDGRRKTRKNREYNT